MFIQKRRIVADEELDVDLDVVDEPVVEEDVVVDDTATDLLFEAEDVAELVAEVTGEPVEVTADADTVVFAVGDDEFTVEAEGDEEILEACRPRTGKKSVQEARKVKASRKVKAATAVKKPQGRVIRRIPKSK